MGYVVFGDPSMIVLAKVLLSVTNILFVSCIGLYIWKRDKFPIAQRFPIFVMLEAFCFAAMGTGNLMAIIDSKNVSSIANCKGAMGIVAICEFVGITTITCRMTLIIAKELRTRNMMENENLIQGDNSHLEIAQSSTDPCTRFLKYIFFKAGQQFTDGQMACIVSAPSFLISLAHCAFVLSRGGLENVTVYEDQCFNEMIYHSVLLQSGIFIYLCICVSVIGALILQLKDNFSIGLELRALLLIMGSMAALILSISHGTTFKTIVVDSLAFNFIVGGFAVPSLHLVQLAFPVYLCFRNERKLKLQRETNMAKYSESTPSRAITPQELSDSLDVLLTDSEGKSLLISFLQSEFSVENLFFLEACAEYCKVCGTQDTEKLQNHVVMIRDMFILEKSVNPVNISHKVRIPLVSGMESFLNGDHSVADPHLFDEAVKEVRKMLVMDSFQRFRITEEYAQFKSRSSQNRMTSEML
jgi:hypothetical protein